MPKISIKAARINKDMTQEDVAKALGVSTPTYIKWETQESQFPLGKFTDFCKLVECDVSDIFLRKV